METGKDLFLSIFSKTLKMSGSLGTEGEFELTIKNDFKNLYITLSMRDYTRHFPNTPVLGKVGQLSPVLG